MPMNGPTVLGDDEHLLIEVMLQGRHWSVNCTSDRRAIEGALLGRGSARSRRESHAMSLSLEP